jgi:hypothetical protein
LRVLQALTKSWLSLRERRPVLLVLNLRSMVSKSSPDVDGSRSAVAARESWHAMLSLASGRSAMKIIACVTLLSLTLAACGVKHDLDVPGGAQPSYFKVDPSKPPHPLGEPGGTQSGPSPTALN